MKGIYSDYQKLTATVYNLKTVSCETVEWINDGFFLIDRVERCGEV